MESTRQHKIGRLLQKEMSEVIRVDLPHFFREGLVTVTKANVTSDLSIARFYLSIFGIKEKEAFLENIRKHSSEFRYKLGNRIHNQLRIVPQVEFFEDDSLDYIDNIEKLLKE
jgi:ribosome-binding factor A